jgi:Protein of unknown function (DUF4089)
VSKLRKQAATGKRARARAKSVATKARAKAKPKARAVKTTPPVEGNKPPPRDPLDQYVEVATVALDLEVEGAWKPAIKANLAVTLRLATLFDDFPLPDDTEPAPVFVA